MTTLTQHITDDLLLEVPPALKVTSPTRDENLSRLIEEKQALYDETRRMQGFPRASAALYSENTGASLLAEEEEEDNDTPYYLKPNAQATHLDGTPMQSEEVRRAEAVVPISSALDTQIQRLAHFDRQSQEYIAKRLAATPPKFIRQVQPLLEAQYKAERSRILSEVEALGGEAYATLPVESQYKADQLREKFSLTGMQATRLAAADHEARQKTEPILAQFKEATPEQYGRIYTELFGTIRATPDGGQMRSGGLVSQTEFGTLQINNPAGLQKLIDDLELAKKKTERNELGIGQRSSSPREASLTENDIFEAKIKQVDNQIKVLEDDAKAKAALAETVTDPAERSLLETDAERAQRAAYGLRQRRQAMLIDPEDMDPDITYIPRAQRLKEALPKLTQLLQQQPRTSDKGKVKAEFNKQIEEFGSTVGVTEFPEVESEDEVRSMWLKARPGDFIGYTFGGVQRVIAKPDVSTLVKEALQSGVAEQAEDGLLRARPEAPPEVIQSIAQINLLIQGQGIDFGFRKDETTTKQKRGIHYGK